MPMRSVDDLMTFDDFITHWAEDRPDRLAMSAEDRRYTYAELEERTARVASMLLAMGLGKGDRIAWIGKNSDLYFTLFYGAARLGVVMTPIGWRLAPPEWAFILNDTHAPVVFTGPGFDATGDALADMLEHGPRFIGADEANALIANTPRVAFTPSGDDDAILQLYTSGTTGNPKGVALSNRNLFALRKAGQAADLAYTKWEDDEVILVAMPCAHIGGTGLGIMALASGLPGHIIAEFTPDGFFDAVEQVGITRLFIVPAASDSSQPSALRHRRL
jgi:acyl-CoA synthetase (AMP-forming)/AMP-acid ligase II